MTLSDYIRACDLMEAAGRTTIPVRIKDLKAMATRIGNAKIKDGKLKPASMPKHFAKAKKAKADRIERGLRKNREAKR